MGRRAKRKKLLLRQNRLLGIDLNPSEARRVGLGYIIDEQDRLAEEAKAEALRLAEEKARLEAEAEAKRLAEEKEAKRLAEEAEAKKLAEEEKAKTKTKKKTTKKVARKKPSRKSDSSD